LISPHFPYAFGATDLDAIPVSGVVVVDGSKVQNEGFTSPVRRDLNFMPVPANAVEVLKRRFRGFFPEARGFYRFPIGIIEGRLRPTILGTWVVGGVPLVLLLAKRFLQPRRLFHHGELGIEIFHRTQTQLIDPGFRDGASPR
jgi:hypothetical protein